MTKDASVGLPEKAAPGMFALFLQPIFTYLEILSVSFSSLFWAMNHPAQQIEKQKEKVHTGLPFCRVGGQGFQDVLEGFQAWEG